MDPLVIEPGDVWMTMTVVPGAAERWVASCLAVGFLAALTVDFLLAVVIAFYSWALLTQGNTR